MQSIKDINKSIQHAISALQSYGKDLRIVRGIEATEIVVQYRKALSGDSKIHLGMNQKNWDSVYSGDVVFLLGRWVVVFFKDAGELDYTSRVFSPGGRVAGFGDWDSGGEIECPLDLLSKSERDSLEQLLSKAN